MSSVNGYTVEDQTRSGRGLRIALLLGSLTTAATAAFNTEFIKEKVGPVMNRVGEAVTELNQSFVSEPTAEYEDYRDSPCYISPEEGAYSKKGQQPPLRPGC